MKGDMFTEKQYMNGVKYTNPITEIRVNRNIVNIIDKDEYKDEFELTLVPKQERYLCSFIMGNHDDCSVNVDNSIVYYEDIEELSHRCLHDELSSYGFIERDTELTSDIIEEMSEKGLVEYDSFMDWTFENSRISGLRSRFEATELSKLEDRHYGLKYNK